jgi:hypothetical protein
MGTGTGFSLDDFMSKNRDFARGYTFYAQIRGGGLDSDDIKYLVKASSLPASTIPVAEVNWQGNKYKLGTTQEFQEFTITYNVDPDDDIRKRFLEWERNIHSPVTNIHGDPNAYMADIELNHLSHRDGSIIMTYFLIQAWPTGVGALTLDYGTKEVAYFDVTFAYQYHTTD